MDIYGTCPECKGSWDAGEMPEEEWEHHAPPYRWSCLIAVEIQGQYDGASFWQCPHCETKWNRFTGEKL